MGAMAFDYTARLESALNRRGNPLSVDAFMDILREMRGHAVETLSAAERDFLLENTDLTEDNLTPQAHESARIQIADDRALAAKEAQDAALTTGEVAELLGQEEATIHPSMEIGGRPVRLTARRRRRHIISGLAVRRPAGGSGAADDHADLPAVPAPAGHSAIHDREESGARWQIACRVAVSLRRR